jgi:predicted Rossmann fold nucleotide-binding protein DprA/Smf involved in DNA uptake
MTDAVECVRLAIVGSTKFADPGAYGKARQLINVWIAELRPVAVISGGAEGIDTMAEEVARQWGYHEHHVEKRLIIHRPKNHRWQPEGFKDRNLLIAHDCTHLLAIRCKQSTTYGSGWTADRAEELGKTVWRERL